MPEPIQRFELVLDDPEPAESSPGRVGWGRILAIGLAFALGLVVGVAALDKQRGSSAARAARAEVSLIAVVAQQSDQHRHLVSVYNAGSLPVHLSDPTLVGVGYDNAPGPGRRLVHKAAPGRWITVGVSTGAPTCDQEPASDEMAIAFQARTDDGDVRRVEVPLLDGNGLLAGARSAECEAIRHPETTINAWLEVPEPGVGSDTGPQTLHIETWGQRPVEIIEVSSTDDNIEISLGDDLPLTVGPPGEPHVSVAIEITVLDCDIQSAMSEITITARYRDQTATVPTWIDPMTLQSLPATTPACGGDR